KALSSAGCWGPTRTVSVTVNEVPAAPSYFVSSNQCGDKTVTVTPPIGVNYYWQSAIDGTDEIDNATSKVLSSSATLYIRAKSTSGCWSTNTTSFTVAVTQPTSQLPPAPSVVQSADFTTVTRGTPPSGETWFWQDAANGESTDAWRADASYVLYNSTTIYLRPVIAGCWGPAREVRVDVNGGTFINQVKSISVVSEGVTSESQIASLTVGDKLQSSSFMDGLGRSIQSVTWQASPGQKDVVSATTYDHRGRVQQSYLPYVSSEATGEYKANAISGNYTSSEQYQFYQTAANVAHDTQPYAEMAYETSPMSRVLEQSAVGSAWTLANDKTAKADFRVYRTSDDGSIYRWQLVNGLPQLNGTYADGDLMVSESRDADNHLVSVYTDKVGRTIVKRVENGSDDRMTYQVYNGLDQLVYIIPPKEAHEIIEGATVDQTYADSRLYHYTYDQRGRVATKETPDGGQVIHLYDRNDRLVLTQDANQRARTTPEWSFIKYDALGRVILTGLLESSADTASLSTSIRSSANVETFDTAAMATLQYTDNAYPQSAAIKEYKSVQYYDSYDFMTSGQSGSFTNPDQRYAVETNGSNQYIALNQKYDQANSLGELTVEAWVNTSFSASSWNSNWAIIDFDRSEHYNLFVHG
ncbi:MAG: DUF6443 domain-containing protein, partial [Verrucomicrobiota bacterium]